MAPASLATSKSPLALVLLRRLLRGNAPLVAALALLAHLFRRWRRRPCCPAVPGNWLLGNLPELLRRATANTHLEMYAHYHALLGRTVKFHYPGKNWVIDTTCPRNVEHVLKGHFENFEKGSWFREPLNELLGEGIFNADGALWHSQRKTASRMFTAQLFKDQIWHVVRKNSGTLCRLLEGVADSGETVDVFRLMNRFTLDTIGEIGFGTDIGSLDDPSSPFLASFDHAQQASFYRFLFPNPVWRFMRFFGIGTERGSSEHFKLLDDYSREVARELSAKADGSDASPSFVGLFLQDAISKGQQPTEKFLRDLVLNFLLAGRDTTAQALSWTVFLLAGNRRVEKCLMEELDTELGPSSDGSVADEPSYEQMAQLPYLHAVVNEALRLYPSVPIDSKAAINDDTLPDGTFVAAGTVVQYSPYCMARDVGLWGSDAEEFRPERWLEMKEPPSSYLYAVFNAGPRECLGKRLAYMEMKACLATILQKISFSIAVPREQIRPSASLTIGMSNGLPCTVKHR
ncbi:unnamed protein product [Polarella glacialis]|uniref:Cytochrome P450 n=1 Tax=Polarella glacialis TaxID=89957 RepID=A0A813E2R8_POLGL|nr:unnamed protein product [Polarella glacialis]